MIKTGPNFKNADASVSLLHTLPAQRECTLIELHDTRQTVCVCTYSPMQTTTTTTKSTTTRLTPQQEMRVICGCWLLAQSTLDFALIRQGDRRGTSIPSDMKYGGNICCLLSEDPDSLMIQAVMSDTHTHTKTQTWNINQRIQPTVRVKKKSKKKKTHRRFCSF